MSLDKVESIVCRIFFFGAFALLLISVVEKLTNVCGYTFLSYTDYTAGRLLEFSSVAALFVAVLLLRQIREELRKKQ